MMFFMALFFKFTFFILKLQRHIILYVRSDQVKPTWFYVWREIVYNITQIYVYIINNLLQYILCIYILHILWNACAPTRIIWEVFEKAHGYLLYINSIVKAFSSVFYHYYFSAQITLARFESNVCHQPVWFVCDSIIHARPKKETFLCGIVK